MSPTHTHKTAGGRFAILGEPMGSGPLESTHLVKYQDMQTCLEQITTMDDWTANWRKIAPDDCPVCLGCGTDQIKGNKQNPCGGCYGLGKVKKDGQAPTELWELADIACGIVHQLRYDRDAAVRQLSDPAVQSVIERQQQDVTTRLEQEWRAGRGKGPGGQRFVGD